MARFAWECLHKMKKVTRDLESLLGPDTGDLTMRIGIHRYEVYSALLSYYIGVSDELKLTSSCLFRLSCTTVGL